MREALSASVVVKVVCGEGLWRLEGEGEWGSNMSVIYSGLSNRSGCISDFGACTGH
jgi:hypothetical protein